MKFNAVLEESPRFCTLCGKKLSGYNAGDKCFHHEVNPDKKPLLETLLPQALHEARQVGRWRAEGQQRSFVGQSAFRKVGVENTGIFERFRKTF